MEKLGQSSKPKEAANETNLMTDDSETGARREKTGYTVSKTNLVATWHPLKEDRRNSKKIYFMKKFDFFLIGDNTKVPLTCN